MQRSGLRFRVWTLMALVAVAALGVVALKFARPEARPRYRMVEVIYRNPDGMITAAGQFGFDLDDPVDEFHGTLGGEARFRELVDRLRADNAEFRVTSPRSSGTGK